MKKSKTLVILFIFLAIILGSIIGGYFLINLIILPQIAIPQIEKQINKTLGQKIYIKNIHLSPKGIIKIKNISLDQKQSSDVFIQAESVILSPEYKNIINSWKKNRNRFDITLKASIANTRINQTPVIIDLNAQADILVKLDLKQPENLDYSVQVYLDKTQITKIPAVGQINNINGTINIAKDKTSSSNIQGTINNAIARLDFMVEDYTEPKIGLNCELSPLIFKLKCALEKDTLLISQLNASYNNILVDITGQIDSIKEDPTARIASQIRIQLEDLSQLPLEIKPVLENIKARGLLKADLKVSGPLKKIPQLAGTILLESKQISILDYVINDLQIESDIENGKINIARFAVNFLDMDLQTIGSVDLLSKALDYNFKIAINDLALGKLKELLAKQAKFYNYLDGVINADIAVKGRALDLSLITFEISTTAENLVYGNIVLPKTIELDSDLSIKNMNNIVLRKAMINDQNSQVTVNGNIENILIDPLADLTGQIKTDLEKIRNYSMIKLPAETSLIGNPTLDFKLKGLLKKINSLDLGFKLKTGRLKFNQFELDSLKADGAFKNTRLDITSLLTELYSGQLKASANADLNDLKKPKFSLNADLENFDMQAFALATKLIQTDFQGLLAAKLSLSGSGAKPDNLDIISRLDLGLNNIKVNNIAIEKAAAQINADYHDNSLFLKDSSLNYKDIQAKAKGTISSLSSKPQINMDIDSKLDIADLNKLPLPQDIKKQLDALALNGKASAKLNINAPLSDLTAVKLSADISSEQLEIKKIKLSNIQINADMRNKLLNAQAKLNAYDGSAGLTATADFNQPAFAYTAKADIAGFDFGKMIQESRIIPQQHKGIASLTADLKGQGKDLKTIVGNANLKLKDTQVLGMPLLKLLAGLIGADFLVNFEITEGNADIIFEDAKAVLQNTSFNGPDAVILARGAILLDNLGFEDFWTTLQLTDSGAKKINQKFLGSFFEFNGTTYQKELEVKGTVKDPKIDKTLFALQTGEAIYKLLKNDAQSTPSQPNPKKDMQMELFKGVLNGIFK